MPRATLLHRWSLGYQLIAIALCWCAGLSSAAAMDTPSATSTVRRCIPGPRYQRRPAFTSFMQDRAWLAGWVMLAQLDLLDNDHAAVLELRQRWRARLACRKANPRWIW